MLENTSCSSSYQDVNSIEDEIKAGICTMWQMKVPPMDGNSHFENLQSTNWNSLRFKNPPSEDTEIGWRVEFRPMDIQLTDFENTALTVMVGMIANIVNHFDLDFIIPVSLIDENMRRAHEKDALLTQKYWFKVPKEEEAGTLTLNKLRETNFLSSKNNEEEKE